MFNNKEFEKYVRARNRIGNIKSFYAHIVFFVVTSLALLLFKKTIINFFVEKGVTDAGFLNWLEVNIVVIPIIWAVVLVFIGIYLLKIKPGFLKEWEKRQIEKYMNKK